MKTLLLSALVAISFSSSVSAIVDADTLAKIKLAIASGKSHYENDKNDPWNWQDKFSRLNTTEKAKFLRKHDSTNALKDVSDEDLKEGIEILLVGNKKEKLR